MTLKYSQYQFNVDYFKEMSLNKWSMFVTGNIFLRKLESDLKYMTQMFQIIGTCLLFDCGS